MSNYDYYLMIQADNTIDVYTADHTHFATYSSLAKSHEFCHPYMIAHNKKLSVFHNRKWSTLHDDDEWVTFILAKDAV